MFRLRFADGGELILTEAGKKKRAGVWLLRPDALEAELAHLGPEADDARRGDAGRRPRRPTRAACIRCSATSGDRRHRPRLGQRDPQRGAALAVPALDAARREEETARLAAAIHDELARGLELRLEGAANQATYRVHDRLGEPCPNCLTPLARVDFEEHTIYYCPQCQTDGRVLKDRRMSRLLR